MNDNKHTEHRTFDNLKAIESGLFNSERGGGDETAKRGHDGLVRDTWRLNQEVLDARREASALKGELNAAKNLVTEQNVLAATSRSALREIRKEVEDMRIEADRREYEITELGSEIGRLKSEICVEKKRNSDLRKKLEQEAAIRQDLEELLGESAQKEENYKEELEILNKELKDKSAVRPAYSREFRPLRYVRKYF